MGGATIAAIATARGEAALAIVRVSGPEAFAVADRVFSGAAGVSLASSPSHRVYFGRALDARGWVLDQVVATVFRGPRSSTGEDVVELTCHGGESAPQSVLEALLSAGAVPAPAGEFTRRAFINGKLGLDQAEAVMDLIHSKSGAAQRAAVRQLQGRLKSRLSALRAALLEVLALLELELDFGEEDVEFAQREDVVRQLHGLQNVIAEMLHSARHADRWRDGVRVVIAGKPNAGKSTLLNALVGDDRVIVSEVPGTTRDFVECSFSLDGLLLRLTDTAGIREAEDEIEREGVRRTDALTRSADVLLYVFDSQRGLTEDEIRFVGAQKASNDAMGAVFVANKTDLLMADLGAVFLPEALEVAEDSSSDGRLRDGHGSGSSLGHSRSSPGHDNIVRVVAMSAREAREDPVLLEALLEELQHVLPRGLLDYDASDGMINQRHERHLRDAQTAVTAAIDAVGHSAGGEVLSMELRNALDALGAITGELTNEDVLSEIFGRFCIGK